MMKKVLMFFFIGSSLFCLAQKKTNVFTMFGMGVTIPKYYDPYVEPNNRRSYSGSINCEYKFKTNVSFISGLEYLRITNNFKTPLSRTTIPEIHFAIDNTLTINSLNIPVNLKYLTKKNYYLIAGTGMNFKISSRRYALVVVTYDNAPKTDYERIADEKIVLDLINPYYKIGLGKELPLCNKKVLAEIGYLSQLNKLIYGPITNMPSTFYKFRNRMVYLSVGCYLK